MMMCLKLVTAVPVHSKRRCALSPTATRSVALNSPPIVAARLVGRMSLNISISRRSLSRFTSAKKMPQPLNTTSRPHLSTPAIDSLLPSSCRRHHLHPHTTTTSPWTSHSPVFPLPQLCPVNKPRAMGPSLRVRCPLSGLHIAITLLLLLLLMLMLLPPPILRSIAVSFARVRYRALNAGHVVAPGARSLLFSNSFNNCSAFRQHGMTIQWTARTAPSSSRPQARRGVVLEEPCAVFAIGLKCAFISMNEHTAALITSGPEHISIVLG